jgi:hypothetical protein
LCPAAAAWVVTAAGQPKRTQLAQQRDDGALQQAQGGTTWGMSPHMRGEHGELVGDLDERPDAGGKGAVATLSPALEVRLPQHQHVTWFQCTFDYRGGQHLLMSLATAARHHLRADQVVVGDQEVGSGLSAIRREGLVE